MNYIDHKSQDAIKDYFATSVSHTDILASSDAALSQPNDSLEDIDCNYSAVICFLSSPKVGLIPFLAHLANHNLLSPAISTTFPSQIC